jgi:hypothetical protein
MVEHRPQVVIDDAFRARLRSELLQSAPAKAKTKAKPSPYPWWLIYTAPLGVTAVLLLLLQPTLTEAPHGLFESPMVPSSSSLQMESDADSFDAYSTMSKEAGLREETAYDNPDIFTASISADRTTLEIGFISLSRPGFVILSSEDGVVAESELILAGEQENISIPTKQSLQSGIIYTAMLYYDNGDGVYSEGQEEIALAEDGNPMVVPTSVTN